MQVVTQQPLGVDLTPVSGQTQKIDLAATNGLTGVADSLAYRTHEIERHLHNIEQFYAAIIPAVAPFCTVAVTNNGFTLTAGAAGVFGAEVQLHDGTVFEGGSATKYFDFNQIIMLSASEVDDTYEIEIWSGTTNFAAATLMSRCRFWKTAATEDFKPIALQSRRRPCNHKLWARVACAHAGASLVFQFGIHTYEG